MRFFDIVLLVVVTAVAYGVVHDQVTVRVSLEYFTIGHPPIFPTHSPTLLALGWGVLATWWVGIPFGFLLATVTQNGRRYEPLRLRVLISLIGRLLMVMAASAVISGLLGFVLAGQGLLTLPDDLAAVVPENRQERFLAAWCAHVASYGVGVAGAIVLVGLAWRIRTRPNPFCRSG